MSERLLEQAAATGHPVVDDVVSSMTRLDGRPVAEHVTAFEEAHDRLREALAHACDDSVSS